MPDPDPGQAVLDYLIAEMQIDVEWCVRSERRFTWWPYVLAQRVWATPMKDRMGASMCQVHIETDLIRNVTCTSRASISG